MYVYIYICMYIYIYMEFWRNKCGIYEKSIDSWGKTWGTCFIFIKSIELEALERASL